MLFTQAKQSKRIHLTRYQAGDLLSAQQYLFSRLNISPVSELYSLLPDVPILVDEESARRSTDEEMAGAKSAPLLHFSGFKVTKTYLVYMPKASLEMQFRRLEKRIGLAIENPARFSWNVVHLYIFFHELGHHKLGHCEEVLLNPPPPKTIDAHTARREKEADVFAINAVRTEHPKSNIAEFAISWRFIENSYQNGLHLARALENMPLLTDEEWSATYKEFDERFAEFSRTKNRIPGADKLQNLFYRAGISSGNTKNIATIKFLNAFLTSGGSKAPLVNELAQRKLAAFQFMAPGLVQRTLKNKVSEATNLPAAFAP